MGGGGEGSGNCFIEIADTSIYSILLLFVSDIQLFQAA